MIVAAADYLIGNKFKIGKEFEKGFTLLGTMVLSMVGMIVISPLLADIISPTFDIVYNVFHIDPSIIPASLLANDMGGAILSAAVAKDDAIGNFNALVVSSMMGATISFTIPFSMQMVKKEHYNELSLGILCGVVTIPIGCLVSGLVCKIPFGALCLNLLPLVILAVIIAIGLIFFPNICVKAFRVVGFLIKILVIAGLVLGIINFLAKKEIVQGLGTVEDGVIICMNASIVMAGMFPLIYIFSKLVSKPLSYIGGKIGMNNTSMTGIVSTLATNVTTFGMMNDMDKKGMIINSSFAVSAAFTFAGHMAFTMSFNEAYIFPVIIGKIISGIFAIIMAALLCKFKNKKAQKGAASSANFEHLKQLFFMRI